MKRFSGVFLVAIAVMMLASGCAKDDAANMKFSGTLELTEHSLGAKVAGRLVTLSTDEGAMVQQGQEIATLDRYEQNKRDYQRIENLFKHGGATQQDLEHAALAVEDQRIVSPLDGIVLVKVHEVGEIVTAGSAVVVVGDRKNLWVKIYVPEGHVNHIKINQSATISFDGLKKVFKGHVSFIASRAEFTPRNVQTAEERITQTFAVKVTIDDVPDDLRPGVAADVKMNSKG